MDGRYFMLVGDEKYIRNFGRKTYAEEATSDIKA
jgi:hypothetical protein